MSRYCVCNMNSDRVLLEHEYKYNEQAHLGVIHLSKFTTFCNEKNEIIICARTVKLI